MRPSRRPSLRLTEREKEVLYEVASTALLSWRSYDDTERMDALDSAYNKLVDNLGYPHN